MVVLRRQCSLEACIPTNCVAHRPSCSTMCRAGVCSLSSSPTFTNWKPVPGNTAEPCPLADRLPYAGPDTILAVHTNAAARLRVSGEKIDLPFAHTHSSMVYCTLKPGFRVPDIPACESATSTGIPCGTRLPPGFFACFTLVELVRLKDLKGVAINLNRNQATSTGLFSPKRTTGRSMPLSVTHKSIFSTRPDGSERHVTHRETNHALRDKILHLRPETHEFVLRSSK